MSKGQGFFVTHLLKASNGFFYNFMSFRAAYIAKIGRLWFETFLILFKILEVSVL